MTVLMMHLEGPMQAWGTSSRFSERETGLEPSKSGVIGILCAALGRSRDSDISDLTNLKIGVRVDREGILRKDFHTTLDVPRASGSSNSDAVISNRYYLSDACFLVGLEGEKILLESLKKALENPKWALFLGRKAFVPSAPLIFPNCMIDSSIDIALKKVPWLGRSSDVVPEKVRVVLECSPEEGEPRMDVPISFQTRDFKQRFVKTYWVNTPGGN